VRLPHEQEIGMSNLAALVSWIVPAFVMTAAHAYGTTYVVDQQGNGQFTDIQPAIDAAQPGDVLLVLPGDYRLFRLQKGLTIIGYGHVSVNGLAWVMGIPSGETAALVHLSPSSLQVQGCSGPVIVQEFPSLQHISAAACTDLRLLETNVAPYADAGYPHGCNVDTARVELVKSTLLGSDVSCSSCTCSPYAGNGMELGAVSRVQVALSNITGGSGLACSSWSEQGANGGDGIHLGFAFNDTPVLYVTGGGLSTITGGSGGGDASLTNCTHNGLPGPGIRVSEGTLWYSGAHIVGAVGYFGVNCLPGTAAPIVGPGTANTPDDPTLDVSGDPAAGNGVQFTLRAPPGSTAILYFGRDAIVVPTPNTQIEQLTPKSRIVNLGVIPASGQAQFTWPVAVGLRAGTLLIAQAEVAYSPSDIRRTNSIPVIVR
jgi:hypothetical protein